MAETGGIAGVVAPAPPGARDGEAARTPPPASTPPATDAPDGAPHRLLVDPAVQLAASLAGLSPGQTLDGHTIRLPGLERLLLHTPQGDFAIDPTTALTSEGHVAVVITRADRQIAGLLTTVAGEALEPPLPVALTMVGVTRLAPHQPQPPAGNVADPSVPAVLHASDSGEAVAILLGQTVKARASPSAGAGIAAPAPPSPGATTTPAPLTPPVMPNGAAAAPTAAANHVVDALFAPGALTLRPETGTSGARSLIVSLIATAAPGEPSPIADPPPATPLARLMAAGRLTTATVVPERPTAAAPGAAGQDNPSAMLRLDINGQIYRLALPGPSAPVASAATGITAGAPAPSAAATIPATTPAAIPAATAGTMPAPLPADILPVGTRLVFVVDMPASAPPDAARSSAAAPAAAAALTTPPVSAQAPAITPPVASTTGADAASRSRPAAASMPASASPAPAPPAPVAPEPGAPASSPAAPSVIDASDAPDIVAPPMVTATLAAAAGASPTPATAPITENMLAQPVVRFLLQALKRAGFAAEPAAGGDDTDGDSAMRLRAATAALLEKAALPREGLPEAPASRVPLTLGTPTGPVPLVMSIWPERDEKRHGERQEEQEHAPTTRFAVDIAFERLGHVRLDGAVTDSHLALRLGSETPLGASVEDSTRSACLAALEAGGMTGELRFARY